MSQAIRDRLLGAVSVSILIVLYFMITGCADMTRITDEGAKQCAEAYEADVKTIASSALPRDKYERYVANGYSFTSMSEIPSSLKEPARSARAACYAAAPRERIGPEGMAGGGYIGQHGSAINMTIGGGSSVTFY